MAIKISYNPSNSDTLHAELPLSKSIAARVACLDFLAGREVRMHSDACDDEKIIAQALRSLPSGSAPLGASGTARRFLSAIIASTPGAEVRLRGSERLMARPMGPLAEALCLLGAPPAEQTGPQTELVRGAQLRSPGVIEIDASVSSQFISALLMIGPRVNGGLDLRLRGVAVSRSYISMTIDLMRRYGARVSADGLHYRVEEGAYAPCERYIEEPDWSAASYFLEFTAITDKVVTLPDPSGSIQGDARSPDIFEQLRTWQTGTFRADMADMPDLVPSVAATACALQIPFELTGIAHLRHKESDRLAALQKELGKMGAEIEIRGDSLASLSDSPLRMPAEPLCVYDDHRLMMSFVPLAALFAGLPLEIDGSEDVANKSFPSFRQQFSNLGFDFSI